MLLDLVCKNYLYEKTYFSINFRLNFVVKKKPLLSYKTRKTPTRQTNVSLLTRSIAKLRVYTVHTSSKLLSKQSVVAVIAVQSGLVNVEEQCLENVTYTLLRYYFFLTQKIMFWSLI